MNPRKRLHSALLLLLMSAGGANALEASKKATERGLDVLAQPLKGSRPAELKKMTYEDFCCSLFLPLYIELFGRDLA
jgi:hypothetical protein